MSIKDDIVKFRNILTEGAVTIKEAHVSFDRSLPTGFMIVRGNDTVAIQTDWDYPGVASRMGWQACECGATDGTVDCPHHKAIEMINSAFEWIEQHEGEEFPELDDYFTSGQMSEQTHNLDESIEDVLSAHGYTGPSAPPPNYKSTGGKGKIWVHPNTKHVALMPDFSSKLVYHFDDAGNRTHKGSLLDKTQLKLHLNKIHAKEQGDDLTMESLEEKYLALNENGSSGGTCAGNVATAVGGLGAGDPAASIYYKGPTTVKKKKKPAVIKRNM